MTRLIDAELLTSKISFAGFPHIDRNGRIDKSWVYELINGCPTIEKRTHGKWIESDVPESVLVKCSICGFDCGAKTHNFCPNCGSEMETDDD